MKIKYKTKFNIGDKVVVRGIPFDGYCVLGTVKEINLNVDSNGIHLEDYLVYISGWGLKHIREDNVQLLAEFDKEQKQRGLGYDKYLNWLNEQKAFKE